MKAEEDKVVRQKGEIIIKWLPIFFTAVAGIFTIINFIFFDTTNKELTNARLKIDNELRPREFENNLRLTLYKEVKDAVKEKDSSAQNATLLVVNEMLDDDSAFKEKLINILLQATNSQKLMETQQKLDAFKEGQDSIKSSNRTVTIDVFYLEDLLKEAEPLAERVCSILRSKYPQLGYTIRKRLLPKSINARIGYQIDFNQIRYDIGSEEEQMAKEILREIQKNNIFPKEQPVLKGIYSNTKGYMSIFIRNM